MSVAGQKILERIVARNNNRVTIEAYLFQKKKENINKTLKEQKYGRSNKIWVRELVMQGEGISIPHIRYTQWKSFS